MTPSNSTVVTATGLALLAAGVVCALFASGVGAGYLFDDLGSVVPLRQLQSAPEYFWEMVLADGSGPVGRPLTILSYAVEQRFFLAEPSFSQGVSIALHLLNASLVFVLVDSLLKVRDVRAPFLFALAAALLWSCAPQKVSTVLYIAQRMAILSTFFVLSALVSYLLARTAVSRSHRVVWFAVCGLCILAAPFAKENGVLAIPLIAMLELLAIPYRDKRSGRAGYKLAAIVVLLLGAAAFAAVGLFEYSRADVTYAARNFSYLDRLGSAPVILADYIRQFFVPDTARMGVIHDDYPLTSLFDLSIAAIALSGLWLLGLAYVVSCAVKQKTSLLAMPIGFFLIGHSIESFFLPLELYFEHRNYLPSVGLAVLFAAGLSALSARSPGGSRRPAMTLAGVYVASLLLSTYALAAHWRSPAALLEHDVTGHPDSSRIMADVALNQASWGQADAARISIARSFALSRTQAAAKAMGAADPALLNIAVSCLASEDALSGLPLVDTVLEGDPIRSSSLRVLRRMHDDNNCGDFDWDAVSDWLQSLTSATLELGYTIRIPALVDLMDFEKARGNPVGYFIYASIAASVDRSPAVVLRWAEAALAVEDPEATAEAFSELERLAATDAMNAFELRLFERLK